MNIGFQTIDQIEDVDVERIGTGLPGLDRIYGNTNGWSFGMPRKSISMIAGSSGVGKSRIVTKISSFLNNKGLKVFYFQLEANLPSFKNWGDIRTLKNPSNFFVSQEQNHNKQIEMCLQLKPDLVVTDSVNMLEDSHHSNVKQIMKDYISMVNQVNCHQILIGQLDMTSKDKKVRGSADWVYLPDCILFVNKFEIGKDQIKEAKAKLNIKQKELFEKELDKKRKQFDKTIVIEAPFKNRYGLVRFQEFLEHTDKGIEYISRY